ncbi:hypothetical protein DPMN_102301 [Dreissena polymorpha]|uniref:Uncharacterized protein n=1 Tax=Dreissena polymorpha TaxID=45954 RepID=A0A9D4R8Z0_DREPO|nr:hypothetical protein DPMN_102301 [Dreissena polymorpha]
MLSFSLNVTGENDNLELPKTAVLACRNPEDIAGPTRINTNLHVGYTVHMPDRAGYYPDIMGLGL